MATYDVTVKSGHNNPRPHSMSPGDVQNIHFNTGTGNRGGSIAAYAGSSYMQFDWALLNADGSPVMVNGKPVAGKDAATPRVQFYPTGSGTIGGPFFDQNTDAIFRIIKTAEDSSGPFGVDCDFSPFHTK